MELPGAASLAGLRVGTYLHGPFLPRNPHVAEHSSAPPSPGPGRAPTFQPLDDTREWEAHDRTWSAAAVDRGPITAVPAFVAPSTPPANLVGF